MTNKTDAAELNTAPPKRSLGIEWYGQTAASLCWMASVFVYGIDGTGDILQLCAASAWLIANIFTAITKQNDGSIR